MSNQILQLISILGAIVGVIGATLAFKSLKNKGVDVEGYINTTKEVINIADKTLEVAKEIAPNNPGIKTLDVIEKWARIATGEAEQLNHSGVLDKDERKETAQNAVYNVLEELGIGLTDKRKELIDTAIQNAVKELVHKNKTDQEKEIEKEDLQNKLKEKEKENETLKETINKIQNTVATV